MIAPMHQFQGTFFSFLKRHLECHELIYPSLLPGLQYGGGHWTVPELVFEKKQLIPALQQLLIAYPGFTA